jgi:hypothetical protein
MVTVLTYSHRGAPWKRLNTDSHNTGEECTCNQVIPVRNTSVTQETVNTNVKQEIIQTYIVHEVDKNASSSVVKATTNTNSVTRTDNTSVTQGSLDTEVKRERSLINDDVKLLISMATKAKQELAKSKQQVLENTNISPNPEKTSVTKNTPKKVVKMKNARNRTISYRIPDEFDAEKLKIETEAYVCPKCYHKGGINGCSCIKPGIFGTKPFR